MNYQAQPQPLPFDLLKLLVILGIIFLVILATGAIIAVGAAVWCICTLPFALLAEATLRIFWLCVLGVVVWNVWRLVRPFFRGR